MYWRRVAVSNDVRRIQGHSVVIARSAAAHGEPVEPRGNLVEVEHVPGNHHCYGDEIATLRSQ